MATLSVNPNPADLRATVNVHGAGFAISKTRLLLDGAGATTNIFRPRDDGAFDVGINVGSTAKTQLLQAQQVKNGSWATVASASIVVQPVVTPPPPPPTPDPTVTFYDDFTGTALSSKWGHHYVCCGSIQHDATLAYVKDGSLHLPVVKRNGQWFGDLIDTRDSFQQTYGLFEASMRVVPGDTNAGWPAFWLYAGTFGQDGDEIDIVEMLGSEGMKAAHQTVHKGTAANQVFAPWNAITQFGLPTDDHVYAVDWRADHIAFLIDGKETWRETSLLISTPKAILLNYGVGGWGGTVNPTAVNGGELIVNWVKARP